MKAIVDGTFAGQADATDVHRFIFSEPMANTIAADGSAYRGQDGDGTVADITCGTAGTTCELNQSAVTIGAATQPAGTVLTVTIGSIPSFTAPGTSPGLQYPVVITQVTSQWDDTSGNQLDLVGSVDKTIEVDEAAPPTEQIPPTATGATQTASSPTTLTVTFSEPVEYLGPEGEFTIIPSDAVCGHAAEPGGTATAVTDDDNDDVLVVAFGSAVAAGNYRLCVGDDVVQDLDGTHNADQLLNITIS